MSGEKVGTPFLLSLLPLLPPTFFPCCPTKQAHLTTPKPLFFYTVDSSPIHSLGWLELRTILAKLHFSYDLELLDKDVDWQRDSQMHTLWKKPKLMVKATRRSRR